MLYCTLSVEAIDLGNQNQVSFPLPDKKIPLSIILIGTFELAVSLLGLIIWILMGQLDGSGWALFVLLMIYGALGAGLWAIQEWARFVNVVLHVLSLPYILYTLPFWEGQFAWQPIIQFVIALSIIFALTRPALRYKFQTVVPKKKKDH